MLHRDPAILLVHHHQNVRYTGAQLFGQKVSQTLCRTVCFCEQIAMTGVKQNGTFGKRQRGSPDHGRGQRCVNADRVKPAILEQAPRRPYGF